MTPRSLRPGVFLDRDGTIIRDAEYLADPAGVELLPGAAEAIKRLNDAGVPVVVVTNQSGIARGLYGIEHYEAVKDRVDEVLRARGARLDATYLCPHHPDFTGPCECRKPGILLFERAAEEHGIDLQGSSFVGDRWRDIAPAAVVGGRGILVASVLSSSEDVERATREFEVATTLVDAVERVLASEPR